MEIRELLVWVFFVLSLLINLALIFYVIKKKPSQKQLTIDARMILQDLISGPALVKIEYLDRSEVFLRSPRDYK